MLLDDYSLGGMTFWMVVLITDAFPVGDKRSSEVDKDERWFDGILARGGIMFVLMYSR